MWNNRHCCAPAVFLLKADHSSNSHDTYLCEAHFQTREQRKREQQQQEESGRGQMGDDTARPPVDVSGRPLAACRESARRAASDALIASLSSTNTHCWLTVRACETGDPCRPLQPIAEFRTSPSTKAMTAGDEPLPPHVGWSAATPHPALQTETLSRVCTEAFHRRREQTDPNAAAPTPSEPPSPQPIGVPFGCMEATRSSVWDDFTLAGSGKVRMCSAPSVFFVNLHGWHHGRDDVVDGTGGAGDRE